MRRAIIFSCLLVALPGCGSTPNPEAESPVFDIRIADGLANEPQDGRLLLMLSTNDGAEPRFQVGNSPDSQLIFGINVEDWDGESPIRVDASAIGFPLQDLSEVPPGKYFVQALLNRYKDFHLGNGKVVSLPPDRGEGQQWNRKPGNFYSTPVEMEVGGGPVEIEMNQVIPEIVPPDDTDYVRHVRLRSELLSEFWGEDVYLGAHVLLPHGFDEHPDARYPLMVFHGHFPSDFGGFRTEPPDPELEPEYSERFRVEGYNIIEQQEAYDFQR